MIELFKIKYDLAPPIMDSMLNRRTICYNFRNLQEFPSERQRTLIFGLETISYRAPELWTLLPVEFKQRNTISLFKVMSDNGYLVSVHPDCEKYLYQTYGLFEYSS